MEYLVVYTSITGNTEKIAMEIFETLPGKSKDIQRVEEVEHDEADLYFVGFWNNRGTCSSEIMDFLGTLHGKQIALFGTCGMGQDSEYYKRTANQVAAFIPDDSIYLGSFLCPGKMPPQVLEKYRRMQRISDTPQMRKMIKNYEEAMLHPDHEDLMNARKFVNEILQKKGSYEYGNTRG